MRAGSGGAESCAAFGSAEGGRWSALRALALASSIVLGSSACGTSDDASPAAAASAGPRHGSDEGSTEPAERGSRRGHRHEDPDRAPPARLVRSEGDVLLSSGPTAANAALEPGTRVTVPRGGHAEIDLSDGARLSLDGDTVLVVNDIGPAQVILVRGAMLVAVPPADRTRATLRIASPESTSSLAGAGEAYIAVHESGTTWTIVLSGLFEVETGETDARRRLRTLEVAAGQTTLAGPRLGEVSEGGYARLDDAREAVSAAFALLTPLEEDRRVRELGSATRRLDESLGALEAEGRHGHELTERHRAAVTAGVAEDATRIQRELVEHAQRLYRLREVATARWERVRALALATSARIEPDPVELRADRVRGLLGE